jgi:iron complex transport system substrate-binding protein
MRAFVSALAASLALCAAAEARPMRIASLNLCTDELLLMLAEPAQIVSVTHLSHKAAETPLWQAARRFPKNDGSLVSIVGHRPELVLTMGGGARDRAGVARRLGIATLDLPYPQSLKDIEASVHRIATATGQPERGKAILQRMDALKASAPAMQHDTIWLGGGGRTVPAEGLAADWMRLAGLRQRRATGDKVTLETLITQPPSILLRSNYRSGQFSSEQRWLRHPLANAARGSRQLTTDGRPWTCMGPAMIDEIVRLRRQVER